MICMWRSRQEVYRPSYCQYECTLDNFSTSLWTGVWIIISGTKCWRVWSIYYKLSRVSRNSSRSHYVVPWGSHNDNPSFVTVDCYHATYQQFCSRGFPNVHSSSSLCLLFMLFLVLSPRHPENHLRNFLLCTRSHDKQLHDELYHDEHKNRVRLNF
jgi:hypothetical protein